MPKICNALLSKITLGELDFPIMNLQLLEDLFKMLDVFLIRLAED